MKGGVAARKITGRTFTSTFLHGVISEQLAQVRPGHHHDFSHV
jgi:hypothetical protein